jgi:PPOX class probable F420-dependent enzyme
MAMATPSIPDTHRDIVENGQVVTLATIGPDGFPQVSAVWYLVDDDGTVAMSLNTARQKTKNLQRTPESTLFFVDPTNPYRTVEIRSRADVQPDPDYVFADRIGARYGGANLRDNDRPGDSRVVVRFVPVKINTFG